MKRILLLIAIIGSINGFSQKHWAGIQFGYNYARMTGFTMTGYQTPSHRVVFGGNYEFIFKDKGLFQAEIIWQQHKYGSKGEALQTDSSSLIVVDQEYYMHYISMPLKLGFKLGDKYAFIFGAGVLPGIQVQNAYTARYNYGTPSPNYKEVLSDKTSRFRVAALVEAGFEMKVLPHFKVFSSLGFYYDLIPTKISGTVNGLHLKPFTQYGINLQFGVRFAVPQSVTKQAERRMNQ